MYRVVEKKLTTSLESSWKPIDYSEVPETTKDDYFARMKRLWEMKEAQDYSCIIIYGDREHYSNIHYFSGYDPRFEEALLILRRDTKPVLVVGNEGVGYAKTVPYNIDVHLYQSFGLMGQPNGNSPKLTELFENLYLPETGKIGLIGWKKYNRKLHDIGELVTDVPHYIVKSLCTVVEETRIENATDLLSDCVYGLKHNITAKEIIQFEVNGTKVSRGVYNAICAMKPGKTELETSFAFKLDGSPANTHPNLNFGDRNVSYGLASAGWIKSLKYGEFVGGGYALRGSLVHKCGLYVKCEADIPTEKKGYMEELVKPYFASVIRWYEMMRIGTSCADIWQMVDDWIGLERCNVTLNPGHMTHTDEWTNSPFSKNSKVRIASGMAFQCDYTVSLNEPSYMSCHVEDGLVIADKRLQEEVKMLSPKCWERIEQRRDFMKNVLNVDLPDEVLPMSDLSAVCFPYMADTSIILIKA